MNKLYHLLQINNISYMCIAIDTLIREKFTDNKIEKIEEKHRNGDYIEAIKAIELSLPNISNKRQYYQLLGFSYYQLEKLDLAYKYFQKSLLLSFDTKEENVAKIIEKKIFSNETDMFSNYEYMGGKYNLGMVIHEVKNSNNNKYITKIMGKSLSEKTVFKREVNYYTKIRENYDVLKKHTPKVIYNNKENKFLNFYTMEKIEPIAKSVNENIISDVATIINQYNNLMRYNTFSKKKVMDNNRFDLGFPLKNHLKSTNQLMIQTLKEKASQYGELKEVIYRLENIIVTKNIYKNIVPSKHYSFNHGDLHNENVLIEQSTGNVFIIDWSQYGFGLKGTDFAQYIACFPEIKYETIINKYIYLIINKEDVISQIFFHFRLIYEWIIKINKNNIDIYIDNIQHTIDNLEKLSNDYI